MIRNLLVLAACLLVVALPFALRPPAGETDWRPGDPVLTIVTPHNEAIRYEFGRAFSAWHRERYGVPVKVDWRSIGGTTEIMRFLAGEYAAAFKPWWRAGGRVWVEGGASAMLDGAYAAEEPPADIAADPAATAAWEARHALWTAFRSTDDPQAFTCRIDLFFGGGAYDHSRAARQGLTVTPWPDGPPPGLVATADGRELIPAEAGGEVWRTESFYGAALSTFGICYNFDRLRDLGIALPPATWADLADPAYIGQIGVGDPTKSGSLAKAFEMIIHEQCAHAVREAGFTQAEIAAFERRLGARNPPPPPADPAEAQRLATYEKAVAEGWLRGVRLVRLIGANARYFTDAAGKVPIDVSMGDAAAGLAIDFYGRYQAETSRAPDGSPRMAYVTPVGGSSVSADPISLLRGAVQREIALRFIEFVLCEDGQKLWTYAPGAPGGPHKFALRRLPVRRDFYPSDDPEFQAAFERHRAHTTDDLGDDAVNPYKLAESFTYWPRWTGRHFNVQRQLVRAMCLDAGEELRSAWRAIVSHGGPGANPAAMEALERLPEKPRPLDWRSAPGIFAEHDAFDTMREWTIAFRAHYREAREAAR